MCLDSNYGEERTLYAGGSTEFYKLLVPMPTKHVKQSSVLEEILLMHSCSFPALADGGTSKSRDRKGRVDVTSSADK